jgi:hypothetical protein
VLSGVSASASADCGASHEHSQGIAGFMRAFGCGEVRLADNRGGQGERAAQLEQMFWDSAYRLERWPA